MNHPWQQWQESPFAAIKIHSDNTHIFVKLGSTTHNTKFSSHVIFGNKNPSESLQRLFSMIATLANVAFEELKVLPLRLVFSISGDVDSSLGRINASDALNKLANSNLWTGFSLTSACQSLLNSAVQVVVLNDAIAYAFESLFLGGVFRAPTLILALGPTIAVSVADIDLYTDQIVLYKKNQWIQGKIEEGTIVEVLKPDKLDQLPEHGKLKVLQHSLTHLLDRYVETFKWIPSTIIITGNLSTALVSGLDKFGANCFSNIQEHSISSNDSKLKELMKRIKFIVKPEEYLLEHLSQVDYYNTNNRMKFVE